MPSGGLKDSETGLLPRPSPGPRRLIKSGHARLDNPVSTAGLGVESPETATCLVLPSHQQVILHLGPLTGSATSGLGVNEREGGLMVGEMGVASRDIQAQ